MDDRTPLATTTKAKLGCAGLAWLVLGSLIGIGAVSIGTFQVVQLLAHEEHTVRSSTAAEGITAVDVRSDAGAIDVVATDGDEIRLTARISNGLRDTRFRYGVVGDRYEVRVDCPRVFGDTWCRAGLRLEVPRDLALYVSGADDRVTVTGSQAAVVARSSDGPLRVTDLSGPLDLHVADGHLDAKGLRSSRVVASSSDGAVDLQFDAPPSSVGVRTGDGRVDLLLPQGPVAYAVALSSGGARNENQVHTDNTSRRHIWVHTADGAVRVRYGS